MAKTEEEDMSAWTNVRETSGAVSLSLNDVAYIDFQFFLPFHPDLPSRAVAIQEAIAMELEIEMKNVHIRQCVRHQTQRVFIKGWIETLEKHRKALMDKFHAALPKQGLSRRITTITRIDSPRLAVSQLRLAYTNLDTVNKPELDVPNTEDHPPLRQGQSNHNNNNNNNDNSGNNNNNDNNNNNSNGNILTNNSNNSGNYKSSNISPLDKSYSDPIQSSDSRGSVDVNPNNKSREEQNNNYDDDDDDDDNNDIDLDDENDAYHVLTKEQETEAHIYKLERRIDDLNAEKKDALQEAKTKKRELDQMSSKYNSLNELYHNLQDQHGKCHQILDQQQKQYDKQLKQYQQQYEQNHQEQIEEYEQETQGYKQQIEQYQQKIQQYEQKIQQYETQQIQSSKQQQQQQQEQFEQRYQEQKNQYEQQFRQYQQQVTAWKERCQQLEQTMQNIKQWMQSLEKQLGLPPLLVIGDHDSDDYNNEQQQQQQAKFNPDRMNQIRQTIETHLSQLNEKDHKNKLLQDELQIQEIFIQSLEKKLELQSQSQSQSYSNDASFSKKFAERMRQIQTAMDKTRTQLLEKDHQMVALQHSLTDLKTTKQEFVRSAQAEIDRLSQVINALLQVDSCREITQVILSEVYKNSGTN